MSLPALLSLFRFKAWSDAELLAALAQLPPERADTLHAALRTLNHIHVVDRLFRAHLAGEPPPYAATNTEATPALAELRAGFAATDAWYEAHVAALDAAALAEPLAFTFTDGDVGRMTREEMLLHVVTHGAYHRGNVGQLLKGIGVAPPRDLYTRFLHLAEPSRRAG